jgi:hypothetical protein
MKKKLLIFVTIFTIFVTNSYAQLPELKLIPNVIDTNIRGGAIKKGDTVQVSLVYKAVTSKPIRSFYLDFQHQITAINMLDITFGSAVPAGATTSYQNQYYPGYYLNRTAQNTTESSQTNSNNASYLYTQNGNKAINRIWAVSSQDLKDGVLCNVRFKVEQVAAGFAYDSIYYNFAQGYSGNYGGTYYDVKMPKPNSSWVNVLATSNALVNGELKLNSNLTGGYQPQIIFVDSITNVVKATVTPSTNGLFTLGSQLSPNTAYKIYLNAITDSLPAILNKAITVSDYTSAATEFIKQNLDGTFTNSNISSGIGYLAADVNENKKLDGGDITALFAQAVGADTIFKAQSGQTLYNVPAFLTSTYDTLSVAGWKALVDKYTINFRTSDIAKSLSINYLIPGDINRSHSSARTQANGVTTYSTPTLGSVKTFGTATNGYVNTESVTTQSIDVSLNNLTVTSNEFTVPITVDTKGGNLSGLQFEFVYDPTKVKFESIKADMPTWIVFVNNHEGRIKFGAVDKDVKTPYTGKDLTPFKLVFSTLQSGLDINSAIKVTANMDASDMSGNQVGINLNSTTIRLTGYNNF